MLVLRERQFILAARTLGYGDARIIFRHAIPNLLRPNLIFSLSDVVLNILALASLSFLGVGVQPPTPELGALIANGQPYLLTAWWITTLPGLVVVLIGVALALVGEAVAERLSVESLPTA
jgi:peptide/nickel transport system permease protein